MIFQGQIFNVNLLTFCLITPIQSEQDRMFSSDESEQKRIPNVPYNSEEKQTTNLDDYHDAKPQGMRYYPGISGPQHPIIPRHESEQILSRAPPRPPSPRANNPEDSDLTDAMVFLNSIKDEYADSLPVYDSFLETMSDFKFGKIDADEVCKAVRILFKHKPFLIRFFDEHHLRYSDYVITMNNILSVENILLIEHQHHLVLWVKYPCPWAV